VKTASQPRSSSATAPPPGGGTAARPSSLRAMLRIRRKLEDHSLTIYCVVLVALCLLPYPLARLGVFGHAPPAAPGSRALSAPAPDVAPAPETTPAPAPERDPALALLESIVHGDYTLRTDVATGRFLRDFDGSIQELFGMRFHELRPLRRGPGWIRAEAPHAGEKGLQGPARKAVVRLVKRDDAWKLEHIAVTEVPR